MFNMLRKISIEGLRGFAEKSEIRLAIPDGKYGSGLTLLTGPNNAGKSTIIEAIKVRSAFHQAPSFNSGMRNSRTDAVALEYHFQDGTDTLKSIRAGSSETVAQRQHPLTPYVVPSRRQFSPYFGRSKPQSRDAYAKHTGSYQGFREQILSNFEGRLFELEGRNVDFDLVLKYVIPNFMEWSIDQNEIGQYFIKLRSNDKSHSMAGSGDGIISVFVIVASLFDSLPGELIAIDEPELSLHPTIQRRLSSLIGRYSADRQIVVSTHSPYFIDVEALKNGAEVVRTWDRGPTIEVFQLSVASCPQLSKLLNPNANNPHLFGLDAREVFFADDPILIFEGQEDVVFWPKAAVNHPQLADIPTYGWGAGGAGNIRNVAEVLRSLGYKQVCGVLDNNRPMDLAALKADFPEYLFVEIPAPDIRTKEATPPRDAINGLLDEKGNVRAQYQESLDETLREIELFISV